MNYSASRSAAECLRRAQNAPVALRIFVRRPKKTFATKSARTGPTGPVCRCPLIGVERKSSTRGQNDANDRNGHCPLVKHEP
jgi:hypothetical protein